MRQKWTPGDLVVIVTVNRGRPLLRAPKDRKSGEAEAWLGEIIGPSLLGPGWWNVRRIGSNGWRGGTFAVPDREIRPRKR